MLLLYNRTSNMLLWFIKKGVTWGYNKHLHPDSILYVDFSD